MKITVAKTAGFCWGVKRAIEKVLELREQTNDTIQTVGPLIHNPQALEMLAERRIETVESVDKVSSETVAIRTHGISPAIRKKLQKKEITICDGTCPRVARIQAIIKRCVRAGKKVVITGDRGHAEVVGLMGFAGESGYVVSGVEDVSQLPELDRVALLSQTTFSQQEFEAIKAEIQARFPHAEVYHTICESTSERQEEAIDLAKSADAAVVIGGRNSSNTRRLAEIMAAQGTQTYQIESDEELQPPMFDSVGKVAVTAGASTPHWMIRLVVDKLESIARQRWRRWLILAGRSIVACDLYVSIGAGVLCLLTSLLLGIQPMLIYGLIAGCYVFAMHLLNHFADPEAVGHNEPLRLRLFRRFRIPLVIAGAGSALAAVVLAFSLGLRPGLLCAFATAMGLLYSARLIPLRWKLPLRFKRLKDIPSSKDLFVGIAWSSVTVLIPALHSRLPIFSLTVLHAFTGIFVLAYVRSVLFDVREIIGDRLVGKETVPTIIGIRGAKILLAVMISLSVLWIVIVGLTPLGSAEVLLLLPPLLYLGLLAMLPHNRITGAGLLSEAITDSAFFVAGLLGAFFAFGGL